MSNNNGAPQPPYNPDGVPQPRYDTGKDQYSQYQPGQTQPIYQPEAQTQAFPNQPVHPDGEYAETVHRYPQAQPGYTGTQASRATRPRPAADPEAAGQNPGDHNKNP